MNDLKIDDLKKLINTNQDLKLVDLMKYCKDLQLTDDQLRELIVQHR